MDEAFAKFLDLGFEGPDSLFEVRLRRRGLGHEPAHAVSGCRPAELLEFGVRTADGHYCDSMPLGEHPSGGQLVSRYEFLRVDLSLQVIEYAEIGLSRFFSVRHGDSVHIKNI